MYLADEAPFLNKWSNLQKDTNRAFKSFEVSWFKKENTTAKEFLKKEKQSHCQGLLLL